MEHRSLGKRRKLDAAVNKPFKSPLKTIAEQSGDRQVPSPSVILPKGANENYSSITSVTPSPSESTSFTPLKSHVRLHQGKARPFAASATSSDPAVSLEIQNTSHEIRVLESTILKTRQDVDTLDQALRLTGSNKDAELDELTAKWRKAAREAAELVFSEVRDKVFRMGGVRAWRERQREMAEYNKWDEPINHVDEEVYDENGDLVEVRKVKSEGQFEEEWEYDARTKTEKEYEEDGGDGYSDDDSFTMDMMLKMLNIDLSVIGYDKKRQRWID
ncbi:uncharacterized protein PV09_00874 [Verruconis gallopava]|uniref:Swi5-dependent recombination DNA repair protein 1 n=1 Tax=Verruconis gallopava TaxID=253628 RepID=A0A0D2AQM5_9PEZI|nr:uncharacterized protein PV09_00874 [Verruconis gallopava]KIW08963.1 hypothetical protein PV09_00874 [Verruconis gallopava]